MTHPTNSTLARIFTGRECLACGWHERRRADRCAACLSPMDLAADFETYREAQSHGPRCGCAACHTADVELASALVRDGVELSPRSLRLLASATASEIGDTASRIPTLAELGVSGRTDRWLVAVAVLAALALVTCGAS